MNRLSPAEVAARLVTFVAVGYLIVRIGLGLALQGGAP